MPLFSCAIAAQRAGENLIGTAGHYQTYVLIECPMPWAAKAFDSPSIPSALRQYVGMMKATKSVQFLCIARGTAALPAHRTMLVYERDNLPGLPLTAEAFAANGGSRFSGGYRGYEFQLENLEQVLPCLKDYWKDYWQRKQAGEQWGRAIAQQDWLVCTHGMRDKCCARFGQPFFREAKRLATEGQLPDTRVWQASHIGGHRFAPTAISLPDGRYYGRMTLEALRAISTRSGAVSQLRSVYRGWGVLPKPLQVLEQQLLLNQGWSWLNNSVSYRLMSPPWAVDSKENDPMQVELSAQQPNGEVITHRAEVVRHVHQSDYAKSCAKASVNGPCSQISPSETVEYSIVGRESVVSCVETGEEIMCRVGGRKALRPYGFHRSMS